MLPVERPMGHPATEARLLTITDSAHNARAPGAAPSRHSYLPMCLYNVLKQTWTHKAYGRSERHAPTVLRRLAAQKKPLSGSTAHYW